MTGLSDLMSNVVAATVTGIDPGARQLTCTTASGNLTSVGYQRLGLAPGSQLTVPGLTGARHLFDVDTIGSAARLDAYLRRLQADRGIPGRGTVVVTGAGFAGIEVAAEMTTRLRAVTGHPRVILVEARDVVGPELGPGPRQVIAGALAELGVEVLLSQRLREVTGSRAVFADGSSADCATVIWTAGPVLRRSSPPVMPRPLCVPTGTRSCRAASTRSRWASSRATTPPPTCSARPSSASTPGSRAPAAAPLITSAENGDSS